MTTPTEVTAALPAPPFVPPRERLKFRGGARVRAISLGIGVLSWIPMALGFAFTRDQMLYSYLVNWAFWLGLALGSLCWLMAFQAAKSRWIVVVRRIMEVMGATMGVYALLFIPIALGMKRLYPWVAPDPRRGAHFLFVVSHLHSYLGVNAFVVRTVCYFLLWTVLSQWLLTLSRRQDDNDDAKDVLHLTVLQRQVASLGLPFVGVAITFAAFDWLMSLDPTWRSTIFGLYYFSGFFAGAMALLIVAVFFAERAGHLDGLVNWHHYHNLGKLLFAFVCFWAYIAFAQYLLIWMANLPEAEIPYYLLRQRGGWRSVSLFLAAGHFFIPFWVLMPQRAKRSRNRLLGLAFWILFAHWVDSYWLVMPFFAATPRLHWQDLAAFLGIGGPSVAWFIQRLRGGYVAPVGDPYFEDSIAFHK